MARRSAGTVLSLLSALTVASAQDAKRPVAPDPVAVGAPLDQTITRSGGAVGDQLSRKQVEIVQKVNAYFNQLTSLKGTFVQTSADSNRLHGKFYVKRPGQFRFDYGPPSKLVIVADGQYVSIQDLDIGTDDRWSLDNTPFRILLQKDVDLLRDARFFQVQEANGAIEITLEDKAPDSSGRIKLVIATKPTVELREWTTKDAQGLDTRIVLTEVVKVEALDPGLFNPSSVTLQRPR
jgi:outer membrane lipoprotein-sorting protein